MENCDVSVHQQDSQTGRRISARQAEGARKPAACSRCPCCRDDQVPSLKRKRQHRAANPPQKRKRTSTPAAEPPEVLDCAPAPPPSTSAADILEILHLVPRPQSTIPPADLPAVLSNVAPGPRAPSPPPHHDAPLMIHNRSVEEYQRLYHEVVDDMLRFKSGRRRPYSLDLGRRIKQKLWERLDRPAFTETVDEDGRTHIVESYGAGVHPPRYDVDISGEPNPPKPEN